MKLRTVREEFKIGDTFVLYPLGDIHLGSANCDKTLLFETVDAIRKDPNARWIGMGDYMEWITVRDKRWSGGGIDKSIIADPEEVDLLGDRYVTKIATILRPIMDKCWGMGLGNHETHFQKEHPFGLVPMIIREAGGDPELFTGWSCLMRVTFQQQKSQARTTLRIFYSHGWQGGRMDGAKVNEVRRLMAYVDADIYLQGHSHSKFVIPQTRLSVNPTWSKVTAQQVYVAHTGSFLRTLQQDSIGYGEQFGYPPTTLGTVRFRIKPQRDGANTLGLSLEAAT